ncbi:hypothetical protein [Algimonas porphyrae]|uniref:Uncharacterized protein n=2 Tax=Algimonas porphyrae TaxID=1128113 RepID=A0ABQ5V1A9_9PROT|nr:hypothetical protein GCM10007854_13160 [Algimonas porphyrae]
MTAFDAAIHEPRGDLMDDLFEALVKHEDAARATGQSCEDGEGCCDLYLRDDPHLHALRRIANELHDEFKARAA